MTTRKVMSTPMRTSMRVPFDQEGFELNRPRRATILGFRPAGTWDRITNDACQQRRRRCARVDRTPWVIGRCSRSMVCEAACAIGAVRAATRPCARRPLAARGNRAERSACPAARRLSAAPRNATARRLPPRPAMRAIDGLPRRMIGANGRRRTRPTQRALLQACGQAGRAPMPSPGRTRPRARLPATACFCAEASVDPPAFEAIIYRRSSICRAQSRGGGLMHLRLSAHIVAVAAAPTSGGTTMTRTTFITTLAVLAIMAGGGRVAFSQETLKVAIPQRGAWDAGVAELGQRGGIFKKHGLDLEILYVQAGPESIQAVIGGSMDIATAAGVSAAVGTFAKGAPIRIIGSEMIGAPDLYWYVPANSPIRKVEDFNGKTVAFSLTGSSSHAALLALIAQHKLTAKPTSTGNIAATITQTMTGQVDVGFGAAPFGLDLVEDGKIRIVATGSDVASLRTRTVRVNLTSVNVLQNRRDAIVRFNRAYQETVAWMYSDPAALKHYAEYSNLPEKIVLRVRDLIPKESMATERVEGIDQIMADAVAGKFIPAPLTAEQVKELLQIPK